MNYVENYKIKDLISSLFKNDFLVNAPFIPAPFNLFLQQFVQEATELINTGLEHNNVYYKVKIKAVICVALAKSYIKYTKGHSGYRSCTKHNYEGRYINGVCFPDTEYFQLRTDS